MSDTRQPSPQLIGHLRDELRRHAPFDRLPAELADAFVLAAEQTYYAPGETLLAPGQDGVPRLFFVRRGAVVRGDFHFDAGDLFPVAAVLARRPVSATYEALEDCFCLEVPAHAVADMAERWAPFADFLNRRLQHFLQVSQQSLAAAQAGQGLAEQSLEAPLTGMPRKAPVACLPGTPLRQALELMRERRVGSVLVWDAHGSARGILTRHDVLERVALAELGQDARIDDVMSQPVHTLPITASAQDAALAMSRHGVRHLPLTDQGRVVSLVSERDLFAIQRRSLGQVSRALRGAREAPEFIAAAGEIRAFVRHLAAQGLSSTALTGLASHLNDLLTEGIVKRLAQTHGVDLSRGCWLSFGSEGRSEQTLATDQDNGIVFQSDDPAADRPRWLAFGAAVNGLLAACGFPLCPGGIMAGQEACCRSLQEWQERFAVWMEQGAPEDLLAASIFFDLRPLAGQLALAEPLREAVTRRARELPRFIRQMAENALRNQPALNWRGALEAEADGTLDLKLHGTAIFVEGARLYALAHGVTATGTRERLAAVAPLLGVRLDEAEAWVSAFDHLQMARLRHQLQDAEAAIHQPNRVVLARLNDIDRRILKEALRVARRLQQRIELDYRR